MSDKQKNFFVDLKDMVLSNREKFIIALFIIAVGIIIFIFALNGFENTYISCGKVLAKVFNLS